MTASARPARTPDTNTVPDSAPDTNDRERASTMTITSRIGPTPGAHRPARLNADHPFVLASLLVVLVAVAAASFTLSFTGVSAAAPWAAIPANLAWLVPVALEDAMLAYVVTASVRTHRGQRAWLAWTLVWALTTVSSTLNALHAWDSGPKGWQGAVGAGLAAMFPFMTLAAAHVVVGVSFAPHPDGGQADTPDAAPAVPVDTGRTARTDWAGLLDDLGHTTTRRRTVRRHRVAGQPRPSRATDHADTILRLKADGQSVRSIAAAVGLSKTTVSDFLRTQEVPA